MFPHFVYDVDPETAQKNFAIGYFLFWLISLITDPVLGLFLDKTSRSKEVMLTLCILKPIFLLGYSVTKSSSIMLIFIVLSGSCKNLEQVGYIEINRLATDEDIYLANNYIMAGCIIGGFLLTLFRLLPDNQIYKILDDHIISSRTSPMMILPKGPSILPAVRRRKPPRIR